MQYGTGAALTAGVAGGTLPFTGLSLAWIVFLSILLIVIGAAMFRIARIPRTKS